LAPVDSLVSVHNL